VIPPLHIVFSWRRWGNPENISADVVLNALHGSGQPLREWLRKCGVTGFFELVHDVRERFNKITTEIEREALRTLRNKEFSVLNIDLNTVMTLLA
jgi:hypothetical protein